MAGIAISGSYTTGFTLSNPLIDNPATITKSGTVSNTGVALFGEAGFAWTVTNLGTIKSSGGAAVGLGNGTVHNSALVAGGKYGVQMGSGTVVNGFGVAIGGVGDVTNEAGRRSEHRVATFSDHATIGAGQLFFIS